MIKLLIKIYLVSFSFQSTILFTYGSIEVNLPTIVGSLVTPLLLLNRGVSLSKSFKFLVILTTWLFFRTAFEYGFDNYILSLFQLLTAIIPSIVVYKFSRAEQFRNELLRILKWQLVLFMPLILRDYGLLNISIFDDLFGEVLNSTRNEYFGIKRSRASFYEPSYFGIFLCTVFFVFKSSKQSKFWLAIVLLEIISTYSFGSYILIFFVTAFEFMRNLSLKSIYKAVFIVSLFILGFLTTSQGGKLSRVISERIQISINVVQSGILTGSEGARINSLPVALSFANESPKNFLFGEGYTYRNWLKGKYGSESLNQFSEGHIFNTFAAVIFHGGMIAFAIYLLFLLNVFKSHRISITFIIIFLYVHFTYSGLQSYFLWMIIFLGNIFSRETEQERNNCIKEGIRTQAE